MISPAVFTDPAIVRDFIDPYGRPYDPTISWCPGGIDLNNGDSGREQQLWYATFNETMIMIFKEFGGLQDAIPASNVTAVSLAFDGNMQPIVCYLNPDGLNLRFFDTTLPGYRVLTEPTANSGLVALDDMRDATQGGSDVIWGYTKANSLYYRVQRERFQTERLISPISGILTNMGPTDERRLMFQVNPGQTSI
jgi:hypothetical protein